MGNCIESFCIADISEEKFYREMVKEAVYEDCQLVVAIDATGSNDQTKFGGTVNYHDVSSKTKNVYERVLETATVLFKQDRDAMIPLYFFGSLEANEQGGVLYAGTYRVRDGDPSELLRAYRSNISEQTLDGPTDFRPIIKTIGDEVAISKQYTVLIIISDGGVNVDIPDHLCVLKQYSRLPMAISCIGIGEGNFSTMESFDDARGRVIDNFQFTCMNDVCKLERLDSMRKYFFYKVFMEVPNHHGLCRTRLGYVPRPAMKAPPPYKEV